MVRGGSPVKTPTRCSPPCGRACTFGACAISRPFASEGMGSRIDFGCHLARAVTLCSGQAGAAVFVFARTRAPSKSTEL